MKGISEDEKCQLENNITMEEVSNMLKNTKKMLPLVQVGSQGHFIRSVGVI